LKKIKYLSLALLLVAGFANANPVTEQTAKTVAANFYNHTFKSATPVLTLTYTEFGNDGQAVYYIYNVGANNGFVIVSAEDAAHPIIGYSNKGQYVLPNGKNNNVAWWLNCRKQEISYARANKISAASEIAVEWNDCINNTIPNNNAHRIASVSPLLSSTWNQSPYYNDMCPGGSVTGCVATAMAQIMRYWQYPSHGHGSSSYWDQQVYGYQNNFGYLTANYDTSNYVWASMPLNVSSTNYEVAKLMYDCGVSVCMDYGPESGAWVITGDYPLCAQTAYVKYFGYNPATIQGLYESKYTLGAWTALIENELNHSRPVQYVGFDSIANAGHTWVCDGYDASNNFDMNWGWGGSDNGYYAPAALNVGYHFNWWNEAVIGIEPPATSPCFSASPTFGCANLTVNYTDLSIANAAITTRNWLFPGGTPATSAATNPTIVYKTAGTYDVSEIVSDINGTDTLTMKAYISVATSAILPLVQNFQSVTFPPTGWVINNPANYSYYWQLKNGVGGYGASTQCMYFNNALAYNSFNYNIAEWQTDKAALDIIGQREQIYTPEYDFTGITKPTVYFDVAYAPYNATYNDTLAIYYSTDCGATFNQVYLKSGMTLCTTGNTVMTGADTDSHGVFVPLSNNWRTDTIKIPAIAGAISVMFAFENRSGNGSPIYIDNINIPGLPANVANVVSTAPSVTVYPNPNNGQFTVGFINKQSNPSVKMYNVIGQEIYSQSNIQHSTLSVDLSTQPKGIYIYRVFSENGTSISTGRLVIE
jgi:PKD repeat protein